MHDYALGSLWPSRGRQFSRFAVLHSGLRQKGSVCRPGVIGRAEALPFEFGLRLEGCGAAAGDQVDEEG